MIDGIFVFDNVIHVVDTSDENTLTDPESAYAREHMIAATEFVMSDEAKGSIPSMKHAFGSDEVYSMVFEHGMTDMAMSQVVPIFDWYENWFAPVEAQYKLAQAYPDRVMFCGGVDPSYQGLDEALDQITYQVEEMGATSFKFYNGHVKNSWDCGDEKIAYPMYERIASLGLDVVQFHKGAPFGNQPLGPLMPMDVERAAIDFPEMRFVIHHLAYPFFNEVVSIAGRHQNVYLSLSGIICLVHLAPRLIQEQLGALLQQVGVHKLFWGSEAALTGCPASYLEAFMALEIPEDLRRGYGYPQITREDKERILGLNFAELMGIDLEAKKAELTTAA